MLVYIVCKDFNYVYLYTFFNVYPMIESYLMKVICGKQFLYVSHLLSWIPRQSCHSSLEGLKACDPRAAIALQGGDIRNWKGYNVPFISVIICLTNIHLIKI